MSGATILRPAAVLLLLAATLPARAQPAPGTPADAELAAVRLIEVARARDWPAIAAFADPVRTEGVSMLFPGTADEATEQLRVLLASEGFDADSAFAAAAHPSRSGPAAGVGRYRRLIATLYADGPLDKTGLVARMLAITARCDPDSTFSHFRTVRYEPIRADARPDGAVEAIGRFSATVDGNRVEGLMVTPLRWTEGRWTIDSASPDARDAELNPIAGLVGNGPRNLLYLLFYSLASGVDRPALGCLDLGE